MKRKALGIILAAVMVLGSLTGCSGKTENTQGEDDEVESIDFMYWNNGADTEDTVAIDRIIEKYEQETGITVNKIVVPEGKFYETLDTRIAGDQAPDLVRVKYQTMGNILMPALLKTWISMWMTVSAAILWRRFRLPYKWMKVIMRCPGTRIQMQFSITSVCLNRQR